MAYSNTSHGSVHALFEASFQKLTNAVSSDTSTVSHKAHCGRVDNRLGNTDFHSHLDIFDELNTKLKHWQKGRGGKLVWLAKLPFKGDFLADAVGLGKSLQASAAALEVKRAMPTRPGFIPIATRAGCVIQWADEIKRHFKPEYCPWWIILDHAKIDTALLLDYDIVIFSRDFLKSLYKDSVKFE
ncbi:hypothetical protein FDENT_13542 [Fusarium denticulatum]|uniref:SNF2 N-terminal domain-containing protein n=1 Tax=Fusarium denticulatum TaxID=48507 RepID=A0A8H5T164_9HYPO|nr:hypothetical protein FDENT_13542 [Fusarium denticulatum]